MRLDSTSAGVLHSAPESPKRLGADFPNCRGIALLIFIAKKAYKSKIYNEAIINNNLYRED